MLFVNLQLIDIYVVQFIRHYLSARLASEQVPFKVETARHDLPITHDILKM